MAEEEPQQQEPVLVMRCPISKKDVNPMNKAVWEVGSGGSVVWTAMVVVRSSTLSLLERIRCCWQELHWTRWG